MKLNYLKCLAGLLRYWWCTFFYPLRNRRQNLLEVKAHIPSAPPVFSLSLPLSPCSLPLSLSLSPGSLPRAGLLCRSPDQATVVSPLGRSCQMARFLTQRQENNTKGHFKSPEKRNQNLIRIKRVGNRR